jgi:hypothetical protein
MSTEEEVSVKAPWHQQSMPIPSWLVVAALACLGPADTMVTAAWADPHYATLSQQVEDLAEQVESLSRQVEDLQSTDTQVAHVLAEVVRALDDRKTE